jgi:hypothetical protein
VKFCALALAMSWLVLSVAARGADLASPATQRAADRRYVVDANGKQPTPVVAATNACAWPILVKASDGALVAAIFNQPSHGRMVGAIDVYASADGGGTWAKRSTAAAPDADTLANRMNIGFDRLPSGDLLLVSSGWSLKRAPEAPSGLEIDQVLPAWICRSSNSGKTWSVDKDAFPKAGREGWPLVPHGSICVARDGSLIVSAYTSSPDPTNKFRQTYVVRGSPDASKWEVGPSIDPKKSLNETYLWHDGAGRWLAAARGARLDLYESTDDARTWRFLAQATENNAVPGMLLKLADGRLLLSHGNRAKGDERVEVRISDDAGRTWSKPARLADFITSDGGYPSSVQRDDGMVVTAYYAKKTDYHDGYHMGVVTWDPAKSFPRD